MRTPQAKFVYDITQQQRTTVIQRTKKKRREEKKRRESNLDTGSGEIDNESVRYDIMKTGISKAKHVT